MTENEPRKTLVETLKDHLPNPNDLLIDQLILMFIKWYNRRILIISILIMFSLPIYMITIGSLFFNLCQKMFYLPLHMIICGSISFLSAILLLIISFLWKKSMKLSSNLTCHKSPLTLMILSLCEILFLVISLICLTFLTIILIRNSNNKNIDFDSRTSINYCHPIVYYSSYVLLFLFYTIFSLILIILLIIFHAYQKTQ